MILRILSKVRVMPSGCWEFTGKKNGNGYGEYRENGKLRKTHRFMWTHYNGEIPKDLVIRHKCDNPPCCNPDHLEVGTKQDNSMDSVYRKRHNGVIKTHCKRGHEFTEINTYVFRNMRHCRTCGNARQIEYQKRKKS